MLLRYQRFVASGLIFLIAGFLFAAAAAADEVWHKSYENGKQATERGDWKSAAAYFAAALAQKSNDTNKIRAYGAVFIQYYPNRELGICYYHLGDMERARQYLQLSLRQSSSARASEYLNKITAGQAPPPTPVPAQPAAATPSSKTPKPAPEPSTTIIGDRLSIAILPFETK